MITASYLKKYSDVLIKSEYIEHEYEYMTHNFHEYEYFKIVLEYRVHRPQVGNIYNYTSIVITKTNKVLK